jgi:selenocysteine lyase/cysteine desulfurase
MTTDLSAAELAELRAEFPITEQCAYLNHASIGAPPRRTLEAISRLSAIVSQSGDRRWLEQNERVEQVRRTAARLFGARRPEELAFVQNTADGLSAVAEGLDWRAGDNVVSAEGEYPSNVYPWMQLAARGVELRQAPERDGRIDPADIAARIDGRTRVLALSWVQFGTGFRSDLAALGTLCRERGVLFVVDAIQALGCLRLDVEAAKIDVCAAGSHKWLLGYAGVGLLYVSDRVVDRIRPTRFGWRSMKDIFNWTHPEMDLGNGALRYECGTLNGGGIDALGTSIELLQGLGAETVERRAMALADRAADGLRRLDFQLAGDRRDGEASMIVAAVHPRAAVADLVAGLEAKNIIVADRAGRLRVAPHVYNSEEEIDRMLAGLAELLDRA